MDRDGYDLTGRVAAVTGAGSGQGRATAFRFARAGASVAALDVNGPAVERLAAELQDAGGSCVALEVDVASASAVAHSFGRIKSELGPIYALAAAAGIWLPVRSVVDLPPEQVEQIFAVNVFGIFNCVREAARQMLSAGEGGRVVLWSSAGARSATTGASAYGASKAAVEGMARAFALDLSPHAICVNVIAPGLVDTPQSIGTDLDLYAEILPARQVGTAAEIAELALYLCSEHVGFITGAVFDIDGGSGAMNGMFRAVDHFKRNIAG
jgi:NAD(P)-dependent dehydrogenase (short-subunit alcohol dehydrogenase family)